MSAWLDPDGEHVWVEHECADGWKQHMLPHPQWSSDQHGTVTPSYHCGACDFHQNLRVDPRSAGSVWCQSRMPPHDCGEQRDHNGRHRCTCGQQWGVA